MWIEKKETQENNEFINKFEIWEITDNKEFAEITAWKKFDENLSKEENFKNAFDESVNNLIEKKLNNIDDKTKENLKELQKLTYEWENDVKKLIENYKEIKELLNSRDWATWKKTKEQQGLDNQEQENKENKNKQDFINKLKEAINENIKKEQENIKKRLQEAKERKEKEEIEKSKNPPEWILEKWPN